MKRSILHHLFRKVYKLFSFVLCLTVCYAVHVTPAFSQGTLVAKKLGSTASPYGYYEYLPTTYYQKSKHPVIVFLSGTGEKGNGTTELDRVLKHGPPKLIKNGSWPSSRPFMIFAPQSSNSFLTPDGLHSFISYLIKTYKVDAARIYLTGLSAGGVSVWKYLKIYQDQIAGAIPISGNGRSPADRACDFKHIPIWAFHGSDDSRVSMTESIYPVEKVNACVPKPDPLAKVTIYTGVGHDAWTRTYDLSGMNSKTDSRYDPYNKNIYDWMLLYSRDGSDPAPSTNQPPVADAGDDLSVSQSTTKVVLNGSDSYDPDGNIVTYTWIKTSGPSATLSGTSASQLSVTNLSAGTYNFQLTVKDDDGATDSDNVAVTVASGTTSSGSNGVSYKYYEGSWSTLPNFSKVKVVKSGKVSNFDISPRNRNDNFAFRFDSYLHITTAGVYTFYTSSDDGSNLYINGNLVVNNDGLHGNQERSGKITLSVGYHPVKVKFFEKGGDQILNVKYAGPGISKQSIPDSKLYTNKPSESSTPTTPPPSESDNDAVAKLYLVDPSNNKRVGQLTTGSEVVLGSGINIEAVTDPGKVGSVKFLLDNKTYSVENVAPYAMGGDASGNFDALQLSPGTYTLKAIPYSESKAKGEAGDALEIKLEVIKGKNIDLNARVGTAAENTFFAKPVSGEVQIASVYPNPVEDKIHIQFTDSEVVGEISCKLLNYTGVGHEVGAEHAQFSDGVLVIDVSSWNLSAGIYLLQVTYNQGLDQKVFRIIKK